MHTRIPRETKVTIGPLKAAIVFPQEDPEQEAKLLADLIVRHPKQELAFRHQPDGSIHITPIRQA